jgi:cytoskeletal protein CcmA (bactofilin family)
MLEALGKKPGDKPCNTIDTLIGARTELKGNLVFSGGLRVDGHIEGNVSAQGEGNSALVVSETAVITGDVTVPHVVVNGRIRGNVTASEKVELQAKATIEGDVGYKILEVQAGAVVIGALRRLGERATVTPIKSAESPASVAKT